MLDPDMTVSFGTSFPEKSLGFGKPGKPEVVKRCRT